MLVFANYHLVIITVAVVFALNLFDFMCCLILEFTSIHTRLILFLTLKIILTSLFSFSANSLFSLFVPLFHLFYHVLDRAIQITISVIFMLTHCNISF
jgi:hypothetical protein